MINSNVPISQTDHQIVAIDVHLDNWRQEFDSVEQSRVVQVGLQPVEPYLCEGVGLVSCVRVCVCVSV